ncbi:MAG: ROK family transcriptional regulator [Bacteroidales bacterium]|jgi:glucokinase-like ROK family protein|nr:ROK family transcriptional regulator [Bacteroidales bacterium]
MTPTYKKIDSTIMNKMNKIQVLNIIHDKKIISRADIVKITGLTPPTVSRIVEQLINQDGLVKYIGVGDSNGGRPPINIAFNGSENYVIAVDLGATLIRGLLSDLNNDMQMEIQVATGLGKSYESIMDNVANVIERLLNKKGLNRDKVLGVGIGIAGLVNIKNGMVDFSPDFGWEAMNIQNSLKQRINLPFIFDNSTRLMALGELDYGLGKKYRDFVVINIGYGIAAGIVIDGKTVCGSKGKAGEFGHILVDSDTNIKCECGAYGCLEALASGRRIAALGKELFEKKKSQKLMELCRNDPGLIDAKLVFEAARSGDKDANEILETVTNYLGIGIASLVNLLDPEVIFMGGGVSSNGEIFFKPLIKAIKSHLISRDKKLDIKPATFADYATLTGAFSLVVNKIIRLESLR